MDNPRASPACAFRDVRPGRRGRSRQGTVFVAFGHAPARELVKDSSKPTWGGYVKTVPGSTEPRSRGVFAAGDSQTETTRQAVTARAMGLHGCARAERVPRRSRGETEGKTDPCPRLGRYAPSTPPSSTATAGRSPRIATTGARQADGNSVRAAADLPGRIYIAGSITVSIRRWITPFSNCITVGNSSLWRPSRSRSAIRIIPVAEARLQV